MQSGAFEQPPDASASGWTKRRDRVKAHEAKVTVGSANGMHAQPVTQFVQLANTYKSTIRVTKDDVTVDGKSVASMLTLGATRGTELGIRAEGPDAARAVKALAELVASDLDAET